jgi:hypothetical protein
MARYAPAFDNALLDTPAGLPASRPALKTPARTSTPAKPGIFHRILDALVEARTRQAEREIARYLATTQGKFTDQVERDIERRLAGPDQSFARIRSAN